MTDDAPQFTEVSVKEEEGRSGPDQTADLKTALSRTAGLEAAVGQAAGPIVLTRPDPGVTETVRLSAGDTLLLQFDPAAVSATLEGEDLTLAFPDGGELLLSNFAAAAESAAPPVLVFAGVEIPAGILLSQILALGDGESLETAAQQAPTSGGGSTYLDDFGSLLTFLTDGAGTVTSSEIETLALLDVASADPFEVFLLDSTPIAFSGSFVFDETVGVDPGSDDVDVPADAAALIAAAFSANPPGSESSLQVPRAAAASTLAFDVAGDGPASAVTFITYAGTDSGLTTGGEAAPEAILLRSDAADPSIVWGLGADSGAVVFAVVLPSTAQAILFADTFSASDEPASWFTNS